MTESAQSPAFALSVQPKVSLFLLEHAALSFQLCQVWRVDLNSQLRAAHNVFSIFELSPCSQPQSGPFDYPNLPSSFWM